MAENYPHNLQLLPQLRSIADQAGCTMAQLALAWILNRYPEMLVIPGTRSIDHLRDNVAAASIVLDTSVMTALDQLVNRQTVSGERYNQATQEEIDTEQFLDR